MRDLVAVQVHHHFGGIKRPVFVAFVVKKCVKTNSSISALPFNVDVTFASKLYVLFLGDGQHELQVPVHARVLLYYCVLFNI